MKIISLPNPRMFPNIKSNIPAYMKNCIITENISVDTTDRMDIVSNFDTVKIRVVPIANTEQSNELIIKCNKRLGNVSFPLLFSDISAKHMIPNVANADSQSDKS